VLDAKTERDAVERCCVCGRMKELFELPGRSEKYCLECSADVATAVLLTTEIDAATMAGLGTNSLVSEFSVISARILARAQMMGRGNSRSS
jgi:hypothetical protein